MAPRDGRDRNLPVVHCSGEFKSDRKDLSVVARRRIGISMRLRTLSLHCRDLFDLMSALVYRQALVVLYSSAANLAF